MDNVLVDHYRNEIADYQNRIDVHNKAILNNDGKRPTDDQLRELSILEDGLAKATGNLERVNHQQDLTTAALAAIQRAAIPAGVNGADAVVYRDEGSAVYDFLNRSSDEASRYRWTKAMEVNRAAQHMGTTAANTTPTAGGFDGLVVTQQTGPIVRLFPQNIPFLTLIGASDVTGAMRFVRLVDPDFATAAGPHTGDKEKGEIPSKKWDYAFEDLKPAFVGNYINLSAEAEFLIPGALNEVIGHLRARTEYGLETRAVTAASSTSTKITLAADADGAATLAAVWDAMEAVYDATQAPATWMVSGPKGQAMLGSKVDLANRPLFPFTGASNALGTADGFNIISPFGLQYAVTPAITDTTILVGNSVGLAAYIRRLPVLQAVEPSVFGQQIGAGALLAFHSTITKESPDGGTTPAERNGIVKIAP